MGNNDLDNKKRIEAIESKMAILEMQIFEMQIQKLPSLEQILEILPPIQ